MKRNKKILVIASTYPRWENDTESRFVHELNKGLAEHFDVVVLAPFFEGSNEYEVMDGVRIYRFKYFGGTLCYGAGMYDNFQASFKNKLSVPSFLWQMYKKMRWIIKHERIKTIHAWWAFPCGFLAAINYKLHKMPYTLTVAGTDIFTLGDNPLIGFSIKNRGIKKIVALSNPLADRTEELCGKNVSVVHIGTNFKNESEGKHNKKVLLCVGRLVKQKGFQYVIENLPEGFELRIVGEGIYRTELENLAEGKNVTFVGALPHNKLVEEYLNAGLFILPSEPGTESLGIVCAEAILCGCPVLARDTGGVSDLIVLNKTGYLFKNNESLRVHIEHIFDNYDETKQKVINGQKHIEENFRWPKITEQYLEFLK